MMEINAFHQADIFVMEITYNGQHNKEYRSFTGSTPEQREEAALLWIYAVEKNKVSEILSRWLRQREKALEGRDINRHETVWKLRNTLNYYNQFKFPKYCQYVSSQRAIFETLAPHSPNSPAYSYFRKAIVPILNRCDEVVAGDQGTITKTENI